MRRLLFVYYFITHLTIFEWNLKKTNPFLFENDCVPSQAFFISCTCELFFRQISSELKRETSKMPRLLFAQSHKFYTSFLFYHFVEIYDYRCDSIINFMQSDVM